MWSLFGRRCFEVVDTLHNAEIETWLAYDGGGFGMVLGLMYCVSCSIYWTDLIEVLIHSSGFLYLLAKLRIVSTVLEDRFILEIHRVR